MVLPHTKELVTYKSIYDLLMQSLELYLFVFNMIGDGINTINRLDWDYYLGIGSTDAC